MEAAESEVVVGETGDDGGSSLHRILHTHWWILHQHGRDVEVQGAGDGLLLHLLSVGGCARHDDGGGGDGGGLHDLHCWFGSLWAIWRLVLH